MNCRGHQPVLGLGRTDIICIGHRHEVLRTPPPTPHGSMTGRGSGAWCVRHRAQSAEQSVDQQENFESDISSHHPMGLKSIAARPKKLDGMLTLALSASLVMPI